MLGAWNIMVFRDNGKHVAFSSYFYIRTVLYSRTVLIMRITPQELKKCTSTQMLSLQMSHHVGTGY